MHNYNFGSASNISSFLHTICSTETTNGEYSMSDSISDSISMAEAKALAALKTHSEAEKRRRDRINTHYKTLLSLLPKTIKAHKASILAETIRHVNQLKKRATELTERNSYSNTEDCAFPGDTDEVRVGYVEGDLRMVKATLCCEDRKELLADLIRALKTVRGKVERVEMCTIGGRTKSVVWIQMLGREGGGDNDNDDDNGAVGGDEVLGSLRRALKVVINRSNVSGLSHRYRTGHMSSLVHQR